MQTEMNVMGNIKQGMDMAPAELVRLCRHRMDAIRLCIQLAKMPQDVVCDQLGIDKGHFSRMMNGSANFKDAKSNELMRVCGNYAPLQYEAWSNGFDLVPRVNKEEIEELRAKLAKLEAIA